MVSSVAFIFGIFTLLIGDHLICQAQNTDLRETALHLAAQNGEASNVEQLLRNGAAINAQDSNKLTPLHRASQRGHDNVVGILLQNGANVNAESSSKLTPLHYASADGFVKVVELLIKAGANVNAVNAINWTAAHSAAQNGQDAVIQLLAQNGADINVMNSVNASPLHIAVVEGNTKVVEALIKNGANVNIANKEGRTPNDIAKSRGNAKIRDLLNTAKPINDIGISIAKPIATAPQLIPQLIPQIVPQIGIPIQSSPQTMPQTSPQTNPPIAPQRLPQLQTMRPAQKACEQYSKLPINRIFGGEPAESGDFPWMAALGYLSDTYQISFDCGGTVISELFILTAAHCVKSSREPVVVRLGKITLSDDDGIKPANHQIQEIIRHPNFSTLTKKDDIALIRLKKDIRFTVDIVPACLQNDLRDEDPSVKLIVTGWGITSLEKNQKSNELLKAQLRTMALNECNDVVLKYNTRVNLPAYRNGIGQSQYCAYDPQGRNDSCQGDSGGPLQFFPTPDGLATVIGVVSFGVSCASELPAFYTRVAFYLDWIESIVWPNAQ